MNKGLTMIYDIVKPFFALGRLITSQAVDSLTFYVHSQNDSCLNLQK